MTALIRGDRDSTIAKEGRVDDPYEQFADIYDRYYRNVLRYALQHAEQASAEDIASETFLVAWRKLPELPEPPLAWLLAVARNLLRQQAGASRRHRLLADRIAALTSAADLLAWDAGDQVVERTAALHALASLPTRDVEALTLVTWHGLDAAQAAVVAGCSARAFTVRLHRARRRLSEALRSAGLAPEHPAQGPGRGTRTAESRPATPASLRQPSTSIPRS